MESGEVGTIDNQTLRLTASEDMDESSIPNPSLDLYLEKNGDTQILILGIIIDGANIDLNVNGIKESDTLTLSYIKGNNPFTDLFGHEMVSFSEMVITNNVTDYIPTLDYLRSMSEDHEWFIPDNAEDGDDIGYCAIYPEYKNIGANPVFSITGGTNANMFNIDSGTGLIIISRYFWVVCWGLFI